jgi:hypothetical protein
MLDYIAFFRVFFIEPTGTDIIEKPSYIGIDSTEFADKSVVDRRDK